MGCQLNSETAPIARIGQTEIPSTHRYQRPRPYLESMVDCQAAPVRRLPIWDPTNSS
jgi:hypothetical protein